MSDEKTNARNITKPIQLWAAFFLGVESIFLTTAVMLSPGWERSALVASAIAYVPIFLIVVAILQTRFRAELQEDIYYSKMHSHKTNTVVVVNRLDALETQFQSAIKEILLQIQRVQSVAPESTPLKLDWTNWRIALNTRHPTAKQIKHSLETANITVTTAFGEAGVPQKWILSINQNMPLDHKVQLLRIMGKFNFDGFLFWQPIKEAGETEDVYIGSYGNIKYMSFSPELRELIKGEVDSFEFIDYLISHTA